MRSDKNKPEKVLPIDIETVTELNEEELAKVGGGQQDIPDGQEEKLSCIGYYCEDNEH